MDGDVLTIRGTDTDDTVGEALTCRAAGSDDMSDDGAQDGAQSYTLLESLLADAWESARGPGMQLRELAVLLVSCVVVSVHGLLGLVPRSLLSQHVPWLLLHWGLAICALYSLCTAWLFLHKLLFGRAISSSAVTPFEMIEKDVDGMEDDLSYPQVNTPFVLDKEDIQRWVDNTTCEEMEQWACGEGAVVDSSTTVVPTPLSPTPDLLTDDELDSSLPRTPELPAPLCPVQCAPLGTVPAVMPPPALFHAPSAGPTGSPDGRNKALSLAYELSVAVRQQANEIRSSLSLPETPTYGPIAVVSTSSPTMREMVHKNYFSDKSATPDAKGLTKRDQLSGSESPKTPTDQDYTQMEDISGPMPGQTVWAPSSLFNFVRRFSGTRFLMKDPGRDPCRPPLELRDGAANRQSLYIVPLADTASKSTCTDIPAQRSGSGGCQCGASCSAYIDSPGPSQDADANNVMKVFSKGILSEGAVDMSTTSLPPESGKQAATGAVAGAGALSLSAQGAHGLTRSCASATNTAADLDFPTRSSLNLMMPGVLSRPKLILPSVDDMKDWAMSLDTPFSFTRPSFRDEPGPPSPPSPSTPPSPSGPPVLRAGEADSDQKIIFDVRKSLLSSIPEVNTPEDSVP